MKEFLEGWQDEITFICIIILFICCVCAFIYLTMGPKFELIQEVRYKDKIIERELGRNFESYEDYLVYRIEIGE